MKTDKPVCVTGASGFVAAPGIRELLERGYRVRGTVRGLSSPGKYDFLTSLPGAADRLALASAELLVVEGLRYDNAKIRRELGVQFRPARQSVVAAVEDLVRWGHLAEAR